MKADNIRKAVKQNYTAVVRASQSSCCCSSSCCGAPDASAAAEAIGYSRQELEIIPQDASLGLGCGSPVGKADLQTGETVLDLGSGAGMDAFLAASKVGSQGRVIGVDMTEAMIEKATAIARKEGVRNVEFRLGEIEKMPVASDEIDVVISNCVVNLSPEKARVFAEAYRVLKPGGRLVVSDIVTRGKLPEHIREDLNMWAACVSGALEEQDYLNLITSAGFENMQMLSSAASNIVDAQRQQIAGLLSITVRAYKPA